MSELFVTSPQRPNNNVNIESEVTDVDVINFKQIPPDKLANIQKTSDIVVTNDATLGEAEEVLLNQAGTQANFIPATGSAIDRFMDTQIGLSDEIFPVSAEGEDALTYLDEKFALGEEVIDLCNQFNLGDLTNAGWDIFKSALDLKRYLSVFDTLADRVLNFDDLDLFDLLGDCPTYLIQTATSKIGALAAMASNNGNIKTLEKIVGATGVDGNKISSLQDKLKGMASKMPQTTDNILIFDTLLTGAGIDKEDLISRAPFGLPSIVAYDTKSIEFQTPNSTELFVSVLSNDKQQMAKRIAKLIIPKKEVPVYDTEDSLLRQFERDQARTTPPNKPPVLISDSYFKNIGRTTEKVILDQNTTKVTVYDENGIPTVKYEDTLTGALRENLKQVHFHRELEGFEVIN